ncbi:MAG TPA: sigma-54 dependent transcriptional regulator [Planctomycetota bacterium]
MSAREQILEAFRALLARATTEAPDVLPELRALLDTAPQTAAPAAEAAGAAGEWHGIVGACPAMLTLRQRIEKFGPAQAPVMITGESGTGKERVAHAIHATSRRAQRAFVAENCAAIPATLLESVLFGHKKGAFTGAVSSHPGHFVSADGGTLFLDEIGEMSLQMQVKLLRTLQEGEVRAVGDSKVRKVDVRVIAATNQDVEAAVKAGRFREDLYFRLNVLRLDLPPLRDRGDDVLLLARKFLAEAAAKANRRLVLSAAAEAALRRAPWPGNVRQLQNEMLRLAALCDGPEVLVKDLSPDLRQDPGR